MHAQSVEAFLLGCTVWCLGYKSDKQTSAGEAAAVAVAGLAFSLPPLSFPEDSTVEGPLQTRQTICLSLIFSFESSTCLKT